MIKYDSDICDKIITNFNDAGKTLESDMAGKVLSDYSALTSVGLFSDQLQNLNKGAQELVDNYDSFVGIISKNKNLWTEVQAEIEKGIGQFNDDVENKSGSQNGSSRRSGGGGGGGGGGGASNASTNVEVNEVTKGKSVSTNDVKAFLEKVDTSILPILLQKINKLHDGKDLVKLLTDKEYSQELMTALKKILGDTTNEVESKLDTETIQKMILSKLKVEDIDISTEEGKSQVEKVIMDTLNTQVDESKWNEILYGNNTVNIEALDGKWVVAKTVQDLGSYVNYVQSSGVKQDANTAEWGDSCLAFAGAHTYDLYAGTKTDGNSAAGYAHAGALTDYMSDSKEEVLSKIYDEIMSGRPMVLQVNGNKAGTSRHFVTVVGFKEGVVSGATLKESDLLIIDSWDGKLERMDTESSRFMTSGAQCGKNYSGYRLRIIANPKTTTA